MIRTAYVRRRLIAVLVVAALVILGSLNLHTVPNTQAPSESISSSPALAALDTLPVRERASNDGYERAMFGDGWRERDGCDTRNIILYRDMQDARVGSECLVMSGILHDPYTAKDIVFTRGENSAAVQIDHVVALSDAWQTGAQGLTFASRVEFANDPLNLLAVDGPANQQKSGSDASDWLPPSKVFRCQYVARQVSVKKKYNLWVTPTEKSAIRQVLASCPAQQIL